MKDDFRKYAVKHVGLNSQVLDDVIKSQSQQCRQRKWIQ